ncbi:MAG: phosphotransferase [Planctomycetales bacterium]|nr:phosphotransferase [Planctomycetales bacterium]
MPEAWEPERVVDPSLARALIGAAFPELAGAGVEPLGVGFDNTAYLVGEEWVFRFPRRAVAVPWMEKEIRLLPAIAARLPLPIPVPERVGAPDARFPWPFAGYRVIPGRTADRAALGDAARASLAAPLGRFLRALHAIPAAEASAAGAGGDDIGRMDFARRAPRDREVLRDFVAEGAVGPDLARGLSPLLEAIPAPGSPPVLVHGDLYARHLLVDEAGRLAGVIDWGDAHVGDPACDLMALLAFLPPAARGTFLGAYGPVPPATLVRSRWRALHHSLEVVRFGRRTGEPDMLREALGALARIAEA